MYFFFYLTVFIWQLAAIHFKFSDVTYKTCDQFVKYDVLFHIKLPESISCHIIIMKLTLKRAVLLHSEYFWYFMYILHTYLYLSDILIT